MGLTKQDISNQIIIGDTLDCGFKKYSATVKGFYFETIKNELYEVDDTGYYVFIDTVKNKADVKFKIYHWFEQYAMDVFDD